ncbi:MAG: beta-propeller fold lactonase family protein, partial [Deltaproteobacteria bacterium]|nr:beta-propeller fold lactonase family protein [Deltaproteobacteria bacterium]
IFSQSVGEGPHEALFTPDGRLVCVPCASGDLYLVPPENPDRFTVLRCGFGAGHVDFSSDGRYAYVANSLDDDVAIVDLVVKEVVARVPAGAGAHRPTLSEDGRLLFVANFVADTVTVIDTRSREVTGTVPVGTYPHDAVRAPGGRIAVCSYGSGSATVIDPARGLAKTELETGQGTSHCGFLCGGALGLFANSISQDVTIVDMEKTTPRATIAVSARATRVDQL